MTEHNAYNSARFSVALLDTGTDFQTSTGQRLPRSFLYRALPDATVSGSNRLYRGRRASLDLTEATPHVNRQRVGSERIKVRPGPSPRQTNHHYCEQKAPRGTYRQWLMGPIAVLR